MKTAKIKIEIDGNSRQDFSESTEDFFAFIVTDESTAAVIECKPAFGLFALRQTFKRIASLISENEIEGMRICQEVITQTIHERLQEIFEKNKHDKK